jgi:nucleoside-diphosphate kinase
MILQNGFEISALEMFNLSRPVVEEFYGVYKGVLPEYVPLIEHMSNGPVIVLEVRQENAVASFREFVGPHDPEIAKHLRPNTIRAQFGIDKVKNAVHCTDLPEDGVLECEYFFNTLQANQ